MVLTLEHSVKERVPAWGACRYCLDGQAIMEDDSNLGYRFLGYSCEECQGKGGRWHEAVFFNKITPDVPRVDQGDAHNIMDNRFATVTKSSYLVRRWTCPDYLGTEKDLKLCVKCVAGPWEVE